MSFDIGKFYRQLSSKIKNTSVDSGNNNKTENKKTAKSRFLFDNYNYKPTVLKDTPEPPIPMYAVPEDTKQEPPAPMYAVPEDTKQEPPIPMYAVPEDTKQEPPAPMYAVPDYTPEPTPEPATTTQPDTSQESNPFESGFTRFLKSLFK